MVAVQVRDGLGSWYVHGSSISRKEGSLRGFTEKVIPVEDKEQLQGEPGVGDEQVRWGAECKKIQEILSRMMCYATVSDFIGQVLGGVLGRGVSRSPL